MNQPNLIDDILRNRLYDAEAAPPAFVWPNVEEALRRKRRRFLLWWCFAGAGLLLFAGAGLLQLRRMESDSSSAGRPTATVAMTAPANATTPPDAQAGKSPAPPSPSVFVAPATPKPAQRPKSRSTTTPAVEPLTAPVALPGTAVAASGRQAHSTGMPDLASLPAADNPGVSVMQRKHAPLPAARSLKLSRKKEKKNCYDFEDHPNVWFADAYAGPSLPLQRLSAPDPQYTDYLAQREASESDGYGFNAGVRGSLLLNRHFLLRTGLHYEQFTQVFEHFDPNFVEYTVKIRSEYIDNMWQTFTDTVDVSYGEHYQKTFNRFGMVDIPLLAGVEWRRGRTGFNVQGGASLNLLFWKQGTMLDTDGQPAEFTPSADNAIEAYKPRVGATITGSVQWFYHLKPRLRVYVEPYYRHTLQPVTTGAYPLQQRIGFAGVQIGLTKILD